MEPLPAYQQQYRLLKLPLEIQRQICQHIYPRCDVTITYDRARNYEFISLGENFTGPLQSCRTLYTLTKPHFDKCFTGQVNALGPRVLWNCSKWLQENLQRLHLCVLNARPHNSNMLPCIQRYPNLKHVELMSTVAWGVLRGPLDSLFLTSGGDSAIIHGATNTRELCFSEPGDPDFPDSMAPGRHFMSHPGLEIVVRLRFPICESTVANQSIVLGAVVRFYGDDVSLISKAVRDDDSLKYWEGNPNGDDGSEENSRNVITVKIPDIPRRFAWVKPHNQIVGIEDWENSLKT